MHALTCEHLSVFPALHESHCGFASLKFANCFEKGRILPCLVASGQTGDLVLFSFNGTSQVVPRTLQKGTVCADFIFIIDDSGNVLHIHSDLRSVRTESKHVNVVLVGVDCIAVHMQSATGEITASAKKQVPPDAGKIVNAGYCFHKGYFHLHRNGIYCSCDIKGKNLGI